MDRNRREFLSDVGRGMLVASVGAATAADLGLVNPAFADDKPNRLSFGALEPLAGLMQDTPAAKLQPMLVKKIQEGTSLRELIAAGALANARQCGGHNYEGFHAFMALGPAFAMSAEMPKERQALPILKVLYRNTSILQGSGGSPREALKPVEPVALPAGRPGGEVLREAVRKKDVKGADATFATMAQGKPEDVFNDLQLVVEDDINVHRVVLAWRSWETLDLTGKQHAQTLLRQSVHFCTDNRMSDGGGIRVLLPKLLDQHKLVGRELGKRRPDDAWVAKLAKAIYSGNRAQAADAVAAALAEGMELDSVGEAIALAANQLLLCDPGRTNPSGRKGRYSVHGDSVGLHASDAANAWRHIARVSNQRNAVASLVVAGYHTAGQAGNQFNELYPFPEHREKVKAKDAAGLLREAEAAIRAKDQPMACATVHRYVEQGHPVRAIFDLMLKYAVSEDGALHAEKYYRTATEEYALARPAFRWRQAVSLTRVTTSEYGDPAPGYADACKLLNV